MSLKVVESVRNGKKNPRGTLTKSFCDLALRFPIELRAVR